MPQPTALPAPEHLAPAPELQAYTLPAADTRSRSRRTITIEVRDVDEALLAGGDLPASQGNCGVATFHARTGADFRWFPLQAATRSEDGTLRIVTDAVHNCELTVTFASQRDYARHGYITRKIVDLSNQRTDLPPVQLTGRATKVQIELPVTHRQAGPLRLQRVDDRRWLPMQHGTSGLTCRQGTELSLLLGAGSYELQDPLHPDRSQQFDVPQQATVTLSESVLPVPDGRL